MSAIAADPTIATSSGGSPVRIAGTTKNRSSTKVTARPNNALSPRNRPNTTTVTANTIASTHSPPRRWWSTIEYTSPSGVSERISTTSSPSSTSGAPGPLGSKVSTVSSLPVESWTTARPQPFVSVAWPAPSGSSAPSGHSSLTTRSTTPSNCSTPSPSSAAGRSPGHSHTIAARVATTSGATTTSAAMRSGRGARDACARCDPLTGRAPGAGSRCRTAPRGPGGRRRPRSRRAGGRRVAARPGRR